MSISRRLIPMDFGHIALPLFSGIANRIEIFQFSGKTPEFPIRQNNLVGGLTGAGRQDLTISGGMPSLPSDFLFCIAWAVEMILNLPGGWRSIAHCSTSPVDGLECKSNWTVGWNVLPTFMLLIVSRYAGATAATKLGRRKLRVSRRGPWIGKASRNLQQQFPCDLQLHPNIASHLFALNL